MDRPAAPAPASAAPESTGRRRAARRIALAAALACSDLPGFAATLARGADGEGVARVFTAFCEVPKNRLIRRCCLIHLKNNSTCHRDRYNLQMVKGARVI